MKKLLLSIFSLAMVFCLMTGCGGGGETETPEEKGLTDGYWVLEKMTMEGVELSGEELESIFGPAEEAMALAFKDDQTVSGVFVEDVLMGTYTGTEESFEIDMGGEVLTGSFADGVVELKMSDGSAFVLKNQEEMPAVLANNSWITYAPEFTAEQTYAMSNFIASGFNYIENDVIYGLTHKVEGKNSLGAIPFSKKGDFPEFGETVILDEGSTPYYLTKDGEFLYYIAGKEKICRIKPDGSDKEVLYEGECDYLQIHDGRLYFTNADYQYVSTDMDGKDLVTVVEREVYYPYFICSDWMIFQDDADGETLHLYNTTHGTDVKITEGVSYSPIMDGTYLYYVSSTDAGYFLSRVDMSDPWNLVEERSELPLASSVLLIDEEKIYTANDIRKPKAEWNQLTDTNESVMEREMYISEDILIYYNYDSEGYIEKKYLGYKGSGSTSFW